ncbi:MAG: putative toxin-antitoxin system toxin component, PIN family [Saprospiraceae bacterium]|nr:putative toxin-antitoxin system toxin component, PIN family [Saprospiraceae bacterium]
MPKDSPIKLILDTNLWISFIISNKLNSIDAILFTEDVRLLFSEELIAEIMATIEKPKLKKYFAPNALEEMLSTFEPFVDLIKIETDVLVCRDPKDNFLLALAHDGKADYLLTGDNDLLVLKKFGRTKIVKISLFLKSIKK